MTVLPHALVRRRLAAEEHGFSMIEVMVAVTILMVVLGGAFNAIIGSISSVGGSRDRQEAVAVANQVIEEARSLPIAQVATNAADSPIASGGTFDPDGAGPLPAEPVEVTAGGGVTGVPFQGDVNGFEVETVVTWFDDDVLDDPHNRDLRRVTTTVTWQRSGGATESVRLSTLIADLNRGA